MSFDTLEKSASSARPVELYKFTGNFSTYRFTNYHTDITNSEGTYVAIPIKRNKLQAGTQEDSISLEVTMSFNQQIVLDYAVGNAPPNLVLELWRVHPDDFDDTLLMWKGNVLSWSIEGEDAKLKVPSSLSYLLSRPCPSPKYQAPCNHVLYDEFCSVDPTAHQITAEVTAIDENEITVDANSFADDDCNGGEMVFGSGERRMIMDNVGTVFTVSSPFSNLAVTDEVIIRKGCDHSFPTCRTKFSNGINFGGFPLVPDKNPFTGKL